MHESSRKRSYTAINESVVGSSCKVARVYLPDRMKQCEFVGLDPNELLKSLVESSGTHVEIHESMSLKGYFAEYTKNEIDAYDCDIVSAVRKQDIDKLRYFHACGRPMKCSNRFGESILHLACRRGFLDVVTFLIKEAKVTVRLCDDYGRTILHDAAWVCEPNFELISLILKECPDLLYMKDVRGHTPLSYSRRSQWADWNTFLKENLNLLVPSIKSERKSLSQ